MFICYLENYTSWHVLLLLNLHYFIIQSDLRDQIVPWNESRYHSIFERNVGILITSTVYPRGSNIVLI